MVSEDKKHALLFNGEIYNHQELRNFLKKKGYNFFTHHSIQVLLKGYKHWEEKLFDKIDGQFAISILDFEKNLILLARDPFSKTNVLLYGFSQFIFPHLLYRNFESGTNKKISNES